MQNSRGKLQTSPKVMVGIKTHCQKPMVMVRRCSSRAIHITTICFLHVLLFIWNHSSGNKICQHLKKPYRIRFIRFTVWLSDCPSMHMYLSVCLSYALCAGISISIQMKFGESLRTVNPMVPPGTSLTSKGCVKCSLLNILIWGIKWNVRLLLCGGDP